MSGLESREQKSMRYLLDFFSDNANFKQFLDVVVFKTRYLPLRLLDWFVANYSKKNDICYNIQRPNGTVETFRVFRSYRAQLRGNKKTEFDPFCRGETLVLEYESPINGEKVAFETAICQLRFFKWAIENLILDYVEKNYTIIYDDMKLNSSKSKKKLAVDVIGDTIIESDPVEQTGTTRRKKTELSKSIYQSIHVSDKPIVLTLMTSKA
jgi:hypothetical protein